MYQLGGPWGSPFLFVGSCGFWLRLLAAGLGARFGGRLGRTRFAGIQNFNVLDLYRLLWLAVSVVTNRPLGAGFARDLLHQLDRRGVALSKDGVAALFGHMAPGSLAATRIQAGIQRRTRNFGDKELR